MSLMSLEYKARVMAAESLRDYYRDFYVPFFTEKWPVLKLNAYARPMVLSEHLTRSRIL